MTHDILIKLPPIDMRPNDNSTKLILSRSAMLAYQRCDREYFLSYQVEGSGISSAKMSIPLLVGSCFHLGVQKLLEKNDIEVSVKFALNLYFESISKLGIELKQNEDDLEFVINEQEALIEALIRCWYLRRYQYFADTYEVLEVEKEEEWIDFTPESIWTGKADGLLLNKLDGELYVLSFKTASQYTHLTYKQGLHDMQGKSEIRAVEYRLEKWWKRIHSLSHEEFVVTLATMIKDEKSDNDSISVKMYEFLKKCEAPPKIFAVLMEFALKGQRRQESNSNRYIQSSSLIHPIKFSGLSSIEDEYKWKIPSGRLPKGWSKINIWDIDNGEIGVKVWIELLNSGNIQPEEGNALDLQIVTPEPFYRNRNEIEEWEISTKWQAKEIYGKLEMLRVMDLEIERIRNSAITKYATFENTINGRTEPSSKEEVIANFEREKELLLMKMFPKITASCHNKYGGDCEFVGICHEDANVRELISEGGMRRRVPHHELEVEKFVEKGWLKESDKVRILSEGNE